MPRIPVNIEALVWRHLFVPVISLSWENSDLITKAWWPKIFSRRKLWREWIWGFLALYALVAEQQCWQVGCGSSCLKFFIQRVLGVGVGGALSPGAGRGTTCSNEKESASVGGYQDLLLCVFGGWNPLVCWRSTVNRDSVYPIVLLWVFYKCLSQYWGSFEGKST